MIVKQKVAPGQQDDFAASLAPYFIRTASQGFLRGWADRASRLGCTSVPHMYADGARGIRTRLLDLPCGL